MEKTAILPSGIHKGVVSVGRKSLKKILPHRKRALMLDMVIIDNGDAERMIGYKKVEISNPFLEGHYPGNPILPGYVLDELVCLTAACLILHFIKIEGHPMVVKKGEIKYANIAKPGDQLVMDVKLKKNRNNKYFVFSGDITNQNGEVVATYDEFKGTAF